MQKREHLKNCGQGWKTQSISIKAETLTDQLIIEKIVYSKYIC